MQRQLLIILIISSISFLAIFGGAAVLFTVKPELFGHTPKPAADTSSIATQPKQNLVLIEQDSIAHVHARQEKLKGEKDSIEKRMTFLRDSIVVLESKVNLAQSEIEKSTALIQKTASNEKKKEDSTVENNITTFAEMYDKMNPNDVASVLLELDSRTSAKILKLMKRKNAARVLELLPGDKAKNILLLSDKETEKKEMAKGDSEKSQ